MCWVTESHLDPSEFHLKHHSLTDRACNSLTHFGNVMATHVCIRYQRIICRTNYLRQYLDIWRISAVMKTTTRYEDINLKLGYFSTDLTALLSCLLCPALLNSVYKSNKHDSISVARVSKTMLTLFALHVLLSSLLPETHSNCSCCINLCLVPPGSVRKMTDTSDVFIF